MGHTNGGAVRHCAGTGVARRTRAAQAVLMVRTWRARRSWNTTKRVARRARQSWARIGSGKEWGTKGGFGQGGVVRWEWWSRVETRSEQVGRVQRSMGGVGRSGPGLGETGGEKGGAEPKKKLKTETLKF